MAVDRAVAKLYAAEAAAEALQMNRDGRFAEAVARLKATARRIEGYAGDDRELCALIHSLREKDDAYAQPMVARFSKSEYYAHMNTIHMRDTAGRAPRRPTSR